MAFNAMDLLAKWLAGMALINAEVKKELAALEAQYPDGKVPLEKLQALIESYIGADLSMIPTMAAVELKLLWDSGRVPGGSDPGAIAG